MFVTTTIEKKLNFWEYKKCGREHVGEKVYEFGVCLG